MSINQLTTSGVVTETNLPLQLFLRGKVRDTYAPDKMMFTLDDDRLLLVATDRLSAFDWVLPSGIPGRGKVLTQLSAFWFERTKNLIANHMISINPDQYGLDYSDWNAEQRQSLAGRSMLARRAKRIDIECVVRGYIAGSAWAEYKQSGRTQACGVALPSDLQESSRLPEPIFTPATKADTGHDENISYDQLTKLIDPDLAARLRDISITIYQEASAYALTKGIIIADTKMEFGMLGDELILIDELLTPDSSRFWRADLYAPGTSQPSLDKQYVRDWLIQSGWNRESTPPELPEEVIARTAQIYEEAFRRLTGREVSA